MIARRLAICIVLCCLASIPLQYAEMARADAPAAGDFFDAAPFGIPIPDDSGKTFGLQWPEPRKVQSVRVEFAEAAPAVEQVRLEYWQKAWHGEPDPVLAEHGAGGVGWTEMDDWTNGQWKKADARVRADGKTLVFTFAPSGKTEFPKLGNDGVTYRKTLKVRVAADAPLPKVNACQVLTESKYRLLPVRIFWGEPAEASLKTSGENSGRVEAYNGRILDVGPDAANSRPASTGPFTVPADGKPVAADLLMAVDPADERYDRTIVTVRSKQRPFSFAADEVARGDRIFIDDLGVLVVRGDDMMTLDAYRVAHRSFPGKTVYDRVAAEPEQTLDRAWGDMPIRHPMSFNHGLPGNRNAMRQVPDGTVRIITDRWFMRPKSPKDTERRQWDGELSIGFGLPVGHLRGGRELRDGWLPVLRTWWQDGPLHYEQLTVLDKLTGDLSDVQLDDPTVLLVQIRAVNTSVHTSATATLRLSSDRDDKLVLEGDRAIGRSAKGERVRFVANLGKAGTTAADGNGTRWSLELAPGQAHNLFLALPSVTPNDAEIQALRKRDFRADVQRICAFWEKLNEPVTQITTPEPWINGFYRTHLQHLLINSLRDGDSRRLLPHVGTFSYGVYANESVMMVSDMDRRGCHDLAARCLESWLHYQGTVGLPGNFKSKEGIFYGVNEHESGGYNKHHGYAMWAMAEHWWFTRDRHWMEAAAPKLVKACEWIIRERQATMRADANGQRVIEYGFLPAGGLEDVQDYWYWLATNAATVWGFDALSAALADYGHPDATRLVKEAKAYHDDVVADLKEAGIRSPVVRLRDGTYVPKIPSEVYTRGRAFGWIRETLEGAVFLPVMGLLDPASPQVRWILQDYEDNLYISDRYGYSIPNFDHFWFSRGGFSMQANLLDGPIPYLQRDEIKHFLRAYFNGLASALEPEIRMCNEHSLPELGYPAGDMFKTSDEAQSTYWLRLMFVHEQGKDLYLGQAIPRYWLAAGKSVGVERAASHFGPLSMHMTSGPDAREIETVLAPPERNAPETIYLRVRHPSEKPIKSVTLNGRPYDRFDAKKEWVILPGTLHRGQVIVTRY